MLPGRERRRGAARHPARRSRRCRSSCSPRSSGVDDKVRALDAGATDYVTKPFSVDELLARVRAHLRTPTQADGDAAAPAPASRSTCCRATVHRDGHPVRLSAKEFELLVHFMRHPNQVLSREQLLSGVWGYDFDPQTNVVEVYVGYLRKKLSLPDQPAPIETIRSAGYRLHRAVSPLAGLRPRITLLVAVVVVVCLGGRVRRGGRRDDGEAARRARDQELRAGHGGAARRRCRAARHGREPSSAQARARHRAPAVPADHPRRCSSSRPGARRSPTSRSSSTPASGDSDDSPVEPATRDRGGRAVLVAAARLPASHSCRASGRCACWSRRRPRRAGRVARSASPSPPSRSSAPSTPCRRRSCWPACSAMLGALLAGGFRRLPRGGAAAPDGARGRAASRRATSARGWSSAGATTRSASWPRRSTRCSTRLEDAFARQTRVPGRRVARAAHAADDHQRPARGPGHGGRPDPEEVRRVERIVARRDRSHEAAGRGPAHCSPTPTRRGSCARAASTCAEFLRRARRGPCGPSAISASRARRRARRSSSTPTPTVSPRRCATCCATRSSTPSRGGAGPR